MAIDAAQAKSAKRVLLEGAELFNKKPKLGLQFLREHGLIPSADDPTYADALARFLLTCPRLDKRELGDFISRPDQVQTLTSFMKLFDFRGVRCVVTGNELADISSQAVISDAMRELLEAFRLPGEAQQIARITEVFAEVYFNAQTSALPFHCIAKAN